MEVRQGRRLMVLRGGQVRRRALPSVRPRDGRRSDTVWPVARCTADEGDGEVWG